MVDSDPATIAGLPQAVGFDAAMYPKGPLTLLDKAAEPVTCVLWQKGSGDSQAVVSTVSGKRLPIPVGDEARVVTLVSGPDRGRPAVSTSALMPRISCRSPASNPIRRGARACGG